MEATLEFLNAEKALLDRKMALLAAAKSEAHERRASLNTYAGVETGRVSVRRLEARPYVFWEEDVILEKEIDLSKSWRSSTRIPLRSSGSRPWGLSWTGRACVRGCPTTSPASFSSPGRSSPATPFCRRAYDRLEAHCGELMAGVERLGLVPDGLSLELYRVDAHDTNLEEEYVTELQVKVRRLEPFG